MVEGTLIAAFITRDSVYLLSDGRVINTDTGQVHNTHSKVHKLSERCGLLVAGAYMPKLPGTIGYVAGKVSPPTFNPKVDGPASLKPTFFTLAVKVIVSFVVGFSGECVRLSIFKSGLHPNNVRLNAVAMINLSNFSGFISILLIKDCSYSSAHTESSPISLK